MNPKEKQLLREQLGDAEPRLCVRSKARIDAGRWWRRTPVWLCVVADQLVMLAVARRRYIESVPLADCSGTRYSPATGELVVEPHEALQTNRFPLGPRDALRILNLLDKNHQTKNSKQC